jgi:glutaminyl-peptide cyclotransferase
MQSNQLSPEVTRKSRLVLLLAILGLTLLVFVVWVTQSQKPVSSLPASLDERMSYEVLNAYPHDPGAFTQGLIYKDGFLYESTGLYGRSTLRKVDLETGELLAHIDLPPEFFAEGLTAWEETLVQLTWREGAGFVYSLDDFTLLERFSYPNEGWGLTQDGERLIMSDGSDSLHFLDPETFQVVGSLQVTWQGDPVERLNELEFIRGEVFANIWQTDDIIRINPHSGEVMGWIDMRGILSPEYQTSNEDVLNGIAYDPEEDRLFITGKRWPKLFEVKLIPLSDDN